MGRPEHDWFLRDWAAALHKRQVDFVRDLDWNKSKASLMWKGEQPYGRDEVNQVADYLQIHPYELLMHPADAMAIRQLRITARSISNLSLVADAKTRWSEALDLADLTKRARR